MAYKTGTATDYRDLLRILRRFITGRAQPATPSYTGTGNGQLTAVEPGIGAPSETWTLTCTAAAANAGTFSVTGSVSGAQAAATVGVAYSTSLIAFTLTDGAADFQVGDQFTVAVTASSIPSGERWAQLRWDEQSTTQELLAQGPGLAASDEIFIGIRSSQNTGIPNYLWECMGHTGYVAGNDFYNQPGKILSGSYPGLILGNGALTYWLVASGRRVVLVAKAGAVYEALYLGFMLPYATPGQYPYPMFVGGSMRKATTKTPSDTTADHRHFISPGSGESAGYNSTDTQARLRAPDGRWATFIHAYGSANNDYSDNAAATLFPYNWEKCSLAREAIDGATYPLTPIVLMEKLSGAAKNLWGELDGCYHVSGFNNAAENLVTVSGQDYLVVQNVFRTGVADFWALKLA